MNKTILLVVLGLLIPSHAARISGVIFSYAGDVSFSMMVPPHYSTYHSIVLDADELYQYEYRDNSFLYVCNHINYSPNGLNFEELMSKDSLYFLLPLTNNPMLSFGTGLPSGTFIEDSGSFAMAEDSLCISGYNRSSKYWKEIQYKDVCIGYKNVPKRKKGVFDECLASFQIDSIRPSRLYVK